MTDSTVTPCSSYFECYNNEALDPFAGSYKNLMATFCVSIGREPNARARQLYEQLFVTSKVQPHIYLMLTQDVQELRPSLSSTVLIILSRLWAHL